MLKDRKHDYRLATHAPAFFREALETALQGEPLIIQTGEGPQGRQAAKRTLEYDLFEDHGGPFYFGLSILVAEGRPDEGGIRLVKTVFDQLIAMDDAARAIPSNYDENEELFEVEIDCDLRKAVFSYSSTLWNTEWAVHFLFGEQGEWVCLGIPDWRSPGQFIT